MLVGILALVVLVIRLFPETPLARTLHRMLVEWPLDLVGRLERRHLILVAIILCTGHLAATLGSAELALAYAGDLSIYADAMLVTALASAGARLKTIRWAFRHRVRSTLARRRGERPRSRRAVPAAGRKTANVNDDDPCPLWAAQAA